MCPKTEKIQELHVCLNTTHKAELKGYKNNIKGIFPQNLFCILLRGKREKKLLNKHLNCNMAFCFYDFRK